MSVTENNFYVTGGTLRSDTRSYVERQADRDLFEGLKRGEFCYVLTSRQMGKSSLMNRTAARLRAEGIAVVLLDLTGVGQNLTPEQWYGGLLERLSWQLDLEDELEAFWEENERLGPLQRFIAALRQVVLPQLSVERKALSVEGKDTPTQASTLNAQRSTLLRLVIFIDEIDTVRSLRFPTDEFFAAIRECYNRRTEDPELARLSFCLLGVATPSDLIQDVRMTPFNIGRRVELNDFTAAEAAPLAYGLLNHGDTETRRRTEEVAGSQVIGSNAQQNLEPSNLQTCNPKSPSVSPGLRGEETASPAAQRLLKRILYWTGGHPYLTQRLCRAVAETPAQNPRSEIRNPNLVDRLCAELFLSSSARERDDNLVFVRERIVRNEEDVAGLLDLYAQLRSGRRIPVEETDRLASLLRLSGIVRVEEARPLTPSPLRPVTPSAALRVRNRIYERVFDRGWVTQHMPDAELRRQKAAYRRGLRRAAAAAAVVIALMAGLVDKAVRAEQEADERFARERILSANLERARILAEKRLREKEAALEEAEHQRKIANGEKQRAQHAQRSERMQRLAADVARQEAEAQRGRAEQQKRLAEHRRVAAEQSRRQALASKEQARARLATLYVDKGNRLVDEGDLLGSLPWLVEALQNDAGKKEREEMDRMRLAAVLQQCPRLLAVLPHAGAVAHAAFSPDGRRVVTAGDDGKVRVWDARFGRLIVALKHRGPVRHAEFSPDGRRALTASNDQTAQIWDASSGRPTVTIRPGSAVVDAEFSPDGGRIVTASGPQARVWDATTGRPVTPPLTHKYLVFHAEFSPDGRRVLTASHDSTARVWDATSGRSLVTLTLGDVLGDAEFSPDGRRVVTACGDGTTRVWDAFTGLPLTKPLHRSGHVWHAEFSPDGRRIVTAEQDGTAQVWEVATSQPILTLKHGDRVGDAHFSRDGRRILTASDDQTARVWDATTGLLVTPPLKHTGAVGHAAFSADGQHVLTAGDDGTARVWDLTAGLPMGPLLRHGNSVRFAAFLRAEPYRNWLLWQHHGQVEHAEFSPDGRRIVTASNDQTARVWDAATGRPITPPLKHDGIVLDAEFSPDGRRVLTASDDATARVWDASTGQRLTAPLKHQSSVTQAEFSPDWLRIVTASADHTARVWDAATGLPITRPLKHTGWLWHVAFSPDGRRIVTGTLQRVGSRNEGDVRVWDATTGKPLTPPLHVDGWVRDVEFSPDGRHIVAATDAGVAHVWDATTGKHILTLRHGGWMWHAEFSPDGQRIVTASSGSARVWDARTGQLALPPLKHNGAVLMARFSPDGRRIVTSGGGGDPAAQVWDATTGQPITPALRQGSDVWDVKFSPDRRRVVTASADGTARVWDLDPDRRPVDDLVRLAGWLSGSRIEPRVGSKPLDLRTLVSDGSWLRAHDPAAFSVSPAQILAWHEREAGDAEAAAEWAAALPHLDVLLAAKPADEQLYARRGTAYAELGRWAQAAADFARASALDPGDLTFRSCEALVQLAQGDTAAYRQSCTLLMNHFLGSENLEEVERVIWMSAAEPNPVTNTAPLVPSAERVAIVDETSQGIPSSRLFLALGAALYRTGRFNEAAHQLASDETAFAASQEAVEGDGVLRRLFRAMAQARLGNPSEARQSLEQARNWLDTALKRKPGEKPQPLSWDTRLILQRLRREAEEIIEGTGVQ